MREILSPSPLRITPACPHYETCGGCQLQHLPQPEQLSLSREGVVESLARVGRISIDPPPVHADAAWGYRNRVMFKVPRSGPPRLSLFCFADPGRNVGITTCPILHPSLQSLIQPINVLLETWHAATRNRPGRVLLRRIGDANVMAWIFPATARIDRLELLARAADIAGLSGFALLFTDQWEDGLSRACTRVVFGPREFRIARGGRYSLAGPENFLQVHDALAERMAAHIVSLPYSCTQRAVEVYCGVGLLAMNLARRFPDVWGIDYDATAIDRAQRAAEQQDLAGARFIAAAAEELAEDARGLPDRLDAAVFNPPRRGIACRALEAILARRPLDLVLASCHPATLARDLAALAAQGWRPASVSLWDLFPQTFHVETVVHLTQAKGHP
ncbi:class I SAM-dependent RNA methyltransferase [bacterium]|nr:class I SAM-dependent RNA methyltransferase [bacterium]